MRIGIAADHGGFALKEELLGHLRHSGLEVKDFGAYALDPDDDFPDFVIPMARAVAAGEVDRGIAVCGSGVGAGVAANKVSGVRAALIMDSFSARQGVEDDDMNVICLGGRVIGLELARELLARFLHARFDGGERFQRRLRKIEDLENRHKTGDGR
jgi:ribose 5-phosphate isomerase B